MAGYDDRTGESTSVNKQFELQTPNIQQTTKIQVCACPALTVQTLAKGGVRTTKTMNKVRSVGRIGLIVRK